MDLREHLLLGQAIPALPLALDEHRRFDERHQRALVRYYHHAGAGGLAVGVHSTQFAIREPRHGLYRPILELAAETLAAEEGKRPRPFIKIAGLCGPTKQAVAEAELAAEYGYQAGLLSLTAMKDAKHPEIIAHCREVARTLPIIGFYLQPSVGGFRLPYSFWREFAEIPEVLAVKIAPFNRYQTLDVVRAVIDAGREDIALYTGNDDNIIVDLLTPFAFTTAGMTPPPRTIVGGLLGQWGVWTQRAVELLEEIKLARTGALSPQWLTRNAALTDINAAVFDAANGFAGVVPGIHEVLRRQGLLAGTWCLDPHETLSPGQAEEITRVHDAYPEFNDDDFVAERLDEWLA